MLIRQIVMTFLFSLLVFLSIVSLTGCGDVNPAGAKGGTYYVNVATGSDANFGFTPITPFKTITRALSVVSANGGGTIYVAPGTYNSATGEKFPLKLSSNVNLIGDITNKGVSTTSTIIASNGGVLYPLSPGGMFGGLFSFKVGVVIPAGVTGASIKGFNIGGGFDADLLIENATATIDSNTFSVMAGSLGNDIMVFNNSNVVITNNSFGNDGYFAHLYIVDNTIATVKNNIFKTAVWNDGILIQGNSTAATSPTVDMGTAAAPGGNTILGGVNVVGLNVQNVVSTSTIKVSGNTWQPNIQGADAAGQYTAGLLISASSVPYVVGNNYSITNVTVGNPSLQFYGTIVNITFPKRAQP